ncbi:MFS transporter [Dactylosporangium sp. NPDC000555]|uniref:MFS transporter n=1 Tax=Dactylosporangium sp. NPDC000555 TaxID=3154260 RepID=UPI00331B6AF6
MSVTTLQRRLLVASTAVNAVGNGAYLPVALLLLAAVTGIDLITVGVVLTAGQLLALLVMPVSGVLVDRFGAARMQTVNHLLRCLGFVAYPLAHQPALFLVLATLVAIAERGSRVAGPALIAEVVDGADRDRYLALDRALSNAGLGFGGVLLAGLLAVNGDTAYALTSWLAAVAFGVAALLTARIRSARTGAGHPAGPSIGFGQVLAHRGFRVLTAANALSAFGYAALSMLVPLYTVRALHLPAPLAGVLFTLNTIICATCGIPLMRWLRSRGLGSKRIARLGLALMSAGFVLMGSAVPLRAHTVAASAVLIIAMVIYSLGEVAHSPSSTSLALGVATERDRGRYLAVYQMSWAISAALAPALFSTLTNTQPLATLAGLVACNAVAFALLGRAESTSGTGPHAARKSPIAAAA